MDALVAVNLLGTDDPLLAEMAGLAREVFERVGARPSLARLDAALAHSEMGTGPVAGTTPASDPAVGSTPA